MRGNTLTIQTETEFFVESCFACGCLFAMTTEFKDARNRDKQSFYCPAGHGQHYTGKSDKQLRREAEARAQAAEDQARAAEAALARQKQQTADAKREVARLNRRASKGVCPVKGCRRSFVDVDRHVANKHPDYHEAH